VGDSVSEGKIRPLIESALIDLRNDVYIALRAAEDALEAMLLAEFNKRDEQITELSVMVSRLTDRVDRLEQGGGDLLRH
jgi:hypothetical protein